MMRLFNHSHICKLINEIDKLIKQTLIKPRFSQFYEYMPLTLTPTAIHECVRIKHIYYSSALYQININEGR